MNKIFNFLKNYKIFNFLKNSDDELVVIPSLDQTSILHIFGWSLCKCRHENMDKIPHEIKVPLQYF